MSNVKWTPYQFGWASYVLDITTGSGNTQMFLGLSYGAIDPAGTGLTQADADGTAAAMQSAVNGLSEVTGSTLTPFSGSSGAPSSVLFDSAAYASFQFSITIPSTSFGDYAFSSYLVTASPVDSILSSGDLSTVTAAITTYMEAMPNVISCTTMQQSITPSTI